MERSALAPQPPDQDGGFRHEALLYRGLDDFVDATLPFIAEGVAAGEPVLVVVTDDKIALLRDALGADADAVSFADMAQLGRNPARIIPAWRDFLSHHGGPHQPVRGVGEPIWSARSLPELDECRRHEALLNVAFAESQTWSLVCPYDVEALDPLVIHEAHTTHPAVRDGQAWLPSDDYAAAAPFDGVLPAPPAHAALLAFTFGPLDGVRHFVDLHAAGAGLGRLRRMDLLLAVTELVTNSLRHGGGQGELRVWREQTTLLCEVRDRGLLSEPLAGRWRPASLEDGGRGLWLVNQLCDLVQIRSSEAGTTVRLHVALD